MRKNTAAKNIFLLAIQSCVASLAAYPSVAAQTEEAYYARCNIKVLKGNEINWLNFRAAEKQINLGTGLKVILSADRAIFKDASTGESYRVDLGAPGVKFLEKLVVKEPVDIGKIGKNHTNDIRSATIVKGMSKEEVYAAVCAPAFINNDISEQAGYAEVIQADKWVYKTNKFGNNITIEFDKSGLAASITGLEKEAEKK